MRVLFIGGTRLISSACVPPAERAGHDARCGYLTRVRPELDHDDLPRCQPYVAGNRHRPLPAWRRGRNNPASSPACLSW